MAGPVVYTVGHSSRRLEELLSLLLARGVEVVVDVRRYPSSRRYPWFSRGALERALGEHGIRYEWAGDVLGGYRRFGVDVEDTGGATCFQSPGFRAYAVYVTTRPEPWRALQRLEQLARRARLAILCRERLPWRCHRKIIADVLALHGLRVVHVIDADREAVHKPSKCARLLPDGRVVYE